MKDKKVKKCKFEALYAVPWAGKIHHCCEGHARGLSALGEALGGGTEIRPIPRGTMCEMNDDLPEEITETNKHQKQN